MSHESAQVPHVWHIDSPKHALVIFEIWEWLSSDESLILIVLQQKKRKYKKSFDEETRDVIERELEIVDSPLKLPLMVENATEVKDIERWYRESDTMTQYVKS